MKTYEATPAMLAELEPLAQEYASADAVQKERIRNDYRAALARFVAAGWTGAVGEANELPDDAMPAEYLANRAQILDQLENQLGRLAIEYRSGLTLPHRRSAVAAYHDVYNEMCRVGHWDGIPDTDTQLPDEEMPPLFEQKKQELIRQYRASQPLS